MHWLFKALGDANRIKILEKLSQRPGLNLSEVSQSFRMSRQGLNRHLELLIEAKIVLVKWRGRERLHYVDTRSIQRQFSQLLANIGGGLSTGRQRKRKRRFVHLSRFR